MAFKINDERAPLDQFLQGESVRAYEFLGSHFVNWDGRQGVVFEYGRRTHCPFRWSVILTTGTMTQTLCTKSRTAASGSCLLREFPSLPAINIVSKPRGMREGSKPILMLFIARLVLTTHPVFTRLTATSGMMKSGMITKRASAQEYACQCLRGKRRFLA